MLVKYLSAVSPTKPKPNQTPTQKGDRLVSGIVSLCKTQSPCSTLFKDILEILTSEKKKEKIILLVLWLWIKTLSETEKCLAITCEKFSLSDTLSARLTMIEKLLFSRQHSGVLMRSSISPQQSLPTHLSTKDKVYPDRTAFLPLHNKVPVSCSEK